jgi:hypothetical protein
MMMWQAEQGLSLGILTKMLKTELDQSYTG